MRAKAMRAQNQQEKPLEPIVEEQTGKKPTLDDRIEAQIAADEVNKKHGDLKRKAQMMAQKRKQK